MRSLATALRVFAIPGAIALFLGGFQCLQRLHMPDAGGPISLWPYLIALPAAVATIEGFAILRPTRASAAVLALLAALSSIGAGLQALEAMQRWVWASAAGVSIVLAMIALLLAVRIRSSAGV